MNRLGSGWSGVVCVVFLSSVIGLMSGQDEDHWRRHSSDLKLENTSLSFGEVAVGSSKVLSSTLVNNSSSSLAITKAVVTETGFQIESPTLPVTLAAGQSTPLHVSFSPKAHGTYAGHLIVSGENYNQTAVASLYGTSGATATPPQLTVNPTSVSFGSVQVGGNQTQPITLTNSGSTGLTLSTASVTGTGFKLTGLTLPLPLAAGQSVSCNVSFAPQASGSVSGSLSLAMNSTTSTNSTGNGGWGWKHHGSTSSTTVPLAGTGVQSGSGLLTPSPSSLSFGTVLAGSHNNLSETLTNTGTSSVTITQANVTGSTFVVSGLSLPLSLNAGQNASFTVSFAPVSTGTASGNLAIVSNASNSMLNIGLAGTVASAAALSANPASLSFGSVQMGSSKTLATSVTNSRGAAATISRLTASGAGYSVPSLTSPVVLNAGQSYTFNVTFAPTTSSSSSGSVSVTSDASNPTLSILLSGSAAALGTLAVTPSSINFGNVSVGTTQSQPATLSARTAPVTISSAGVNNSEFSVSGLTLPLTLPAGGTASFSVMFKPQASGAASANISFGSNATNSLTVEAVNGSGTVATQPHSVALSWNPSSSTVSGYNVYRGAVSGGPYAKINSALDAGASYTDSTVQAGQTYYYVVTAVDGSGTESGYSNQVQAVVPSP